MHAYSVKVRSPNGTMFIVIGEENNKPVHVQVFIGKAGSNLVAYATTIALLCTKLLEVGISLESIIELISNTTSDKSVFHGNIPIRSDVDAIVYAFGRYRKQKYNERNPKREHRTFNW